MPPPASGHQLKSSGYRLPPVSEVLLALAVRIGAIQAGDARTRVIPGILPQMVCLAARLVSQRLDEKHVRVACGCWVVGRSFGAPDGGET